MLPVNRTVWEGSDVWLHCGARGTPSPKLDWFPFLQSNLALASPWSELRCRYFENADMSTWEFTNYQKFANNSLLIKAAQAK